MVDQVVESSQVLVPSQSFRTPPLPTTIQGVAEAPVSVLAVPTDKTVWVRNLCFRYHYISISYKHHCCRQLPWCGSPVDQDLSGSGTFSASYSLVESAGIAIAEPNGPNNIFNIDPLLEVLADNGGLSLTHKILVGSPAIDAGDPGFSSPPDLINEVRAFHV